MRLFLWMLLFMQPVILFSQNLVSSYSPNVKMEGGIISMHQPDGKLLIYGALSRVNGRYAASLVRLNADGTTDGSFQSPVIDDYIRYVAIAPDGKLLICGTFTKLNGNPVKGMARLNADGSVDPTFVGEVKGVERIAFQSDGKIIVIGPISYKGYTVLARLNSNGSLDETYGKVAIGLANHVAVAPDNSAYVSDFTRVLKITPAGIQDPNFQLGVGGDSFITAMTLLSSGKILVAGFTSYNGVSCKGLIQLNPDGTIDQTFNTATGVNGQIFTIAEKANHNILIAGQFYNFENQPASVVELLPTGGLQRIVATVFNNWINSISVGPDGKTVIGGGFITVNQKNYEFLARFNEDYTLDLAFKPDISNATSARVNMGVNSIGELYLAADYTITGIYSNAGNLIYRHSGKFDLQGRYDATFIAETEPGAFINSVCVQSDNKILLGGYIAFQQSPIARFSSTGVKDPTFAVGTGPSFQGSPYPIFAIKQHANKVYAASQMDAFNGTPTYGMVGINDNGTLATAFTGIPASSSITDFDFQSTGKVVAIGSFPFAGGTKNLVRFNADGTLDNTFTPRETVGSAFEIKVDAQDRIYIAGGVTSIDGALVDTFFRLTSTGSIDNTFVSGTGIDGFIYSFVILPDGKLVVVGDFTAYKSLPANDLMFLDDAGTVIPTPSLSFGKSSAITKVIYGNNALYLSGVIASADDSYRKQIAKVSLSTTPLPTAPQNLALTVSDNGTVSATWQDMASNETAFVLERSFSEFSGFIPVQTLNVNAQSASDTGIGPFTKYYYRVKAVGESGDSPYSNTASILWKPKPAAPTGLLVTQSVLNELILSWTDKSTGETGFIIERSVIDDAHFVKIDTVDQNIVTFTDNVSADTKYYYKVTAYNETGNSEYTNIVGITSLSVPAKPLELVAKIITQGSVTLTWHDMSTNESGFKLERSLARSSGFALLQTLAADKTTASDNTIIAKTKYYYRIKSVNAVGESAYSNLDSAFWIPTPSPATELAVKQDKLNELTLTWKDASSDEGGFTIERSTNGTDYTKAGAVAANIVTFKDAVEPNKQYSYRIVAFNDGGNSAPSNTVAFTSLFVPSAPTSATARFIDATKKLVVAWEDHSTNEDGFAIERAPNATSTFTEIARVSANATEFVDTNISSIGSEVYKVRAYNKVSFSEYSNSVSVQLISAIEPVEAIRIEVYPNPTDDLLIVRFDKVVSQGSTWVAIDAIGRAWKLTPTIKENAYQFSVGHLEKGLYILRSINQRNGARSVRFEKQ